MTTPCPPFRFGTRGSALARTQTERVVGRFAAAHPDLPVAVVDVRTEGDIDKTTPLTVIGGRGVFTSALEDRLLAGNIDAAVHSAKDLPSTTDPALCLIAFPEREDPADVLVSRLGAPLADLPPNPVVGTSSRRRAVQVRLVRPDAVVVPLRGNLDTRLRKADGDGFDAVVLAAAGLARMGWTDRVSERLPIARFVPSPGQGALVVEVRAADDAARALLAPLDDPVVGRAVRAERAFLRAIGAGCLTPVGAYVAQHDGAWRLRAMLASEDEAAVEWADEALDAREPDAHAGEIARGMRERLRRRAGARSRPSATEVTPAGEHASPWLLAPPGALAPSPPTPGATWETSPATAPPNDKPLRGVSVLVTRPCAQAAPLVDALAGAGAEPVLLPTTRIEDPAGWGVVDAAVARLVAGGYAWVVLTSANAARRLLARLRAAGVAPGGAALGGAAVAAVGAPTAAVLKDAGVAVGLVPDQARGTALAAALGAIGVEGRRVLYLHGNLAGDDVPAGLAAAGALVDAVEAYRTVPEPAVDPAALARLRRGAVDVLTFASPSSLHSLLALLGGDVSPIAAIPAVCVGPVTAATARGLGLRRVLVADDATTAGMLAAVARLPSRRPDGRENGNELAMAAVGAGMASGVDEGGTG